MRKQIRFQLKTLKNGARGFFIRIYGLMRFAVGKIGQVVASRQCRSICALLLATLLFLGASLLSLNAALCHKAGGLITSKEALLQGGEAFDLVIVLGCGVNANGEPSHMLYDRIQVGVGLYQSGLCDALLMSGDRNLAASYDEVSAMRRCAMEMGVPEEDILVDPYGYSTYESIANLLQEHKDKKILIVTQEYHLYRALYIAEKLELDAYGVGADLRPYTKQLYRNVRELLARVKDVWQVEKYNTEY